MNSASQLIFEWPEMPELPTIGQPILIRVATSASRPIARQELRTELRRILTVWSGLASELLPLGESSRGPRWHGLLGGHSLDISLSYCEGEAWIGLIRGGAIGVDAMSIQPIAEAEAVARHYFDPKTLAGIRRSCQPAQSFALSWTKLEACLKCLKLELTERNASPPGLFTNLACRDAVLGGTAVTVAVAIQRPMTLVAPALRARTAVAAPLAVRAVPTT
jgi:phosphopantetheinyl transferase (holo-ACP synthase)